MGRELKKVGNTFRTTWFQAGPNVFVAAAEPNYEDTPEAAREHAEMMRSLAHEVGRSCGFVVVMSNHISQDAESRKIYAGIAPTDMVLGTALVAENALSRAVGSFFLGLSKPRVPVKLVRSVEEGIVWLENLPSR